MFYAPLQKTSPLNSRKQHTIQTQLPANTTNPKLLPQIKTPTVQTKKQNTLLPTIISKKTPTKSQKIENYMVAGGGFEPPISGLFGPNSLF